MQVAMLPCPKPILILTTRNGISRWTPPGGLPCEGGRQIRFNQISDEHNRGVRFGNGERETDSRASKMLLSIYIYIASSSLRTKHTSTLPAQLFRSRGNAFPRNLPCRCGDHWLVSERIAALGPAKGITTVAAPYRQWKIVEVK